MGGAIFRRNCVVKSHSSNTDLRPLLDITQCLACGAGSHVGSCLHCELEAASQLSCCRSISQTYVPPYLPCLCSSIEAPHPHPSHPHPPSHSSLPTPTHPPTLGPTLALCCAHTCLMSSSSRVSYSLMATAVVVCLDTTFTKPSVIPSCCICCRISGVMSNSAIPARDGGRGGQGAGGGC